MLRVCGLFVGVLLLLLSRGVRYVLFVGCCVLFVVCCLLFAVCCMLVVTLPLMCVGCCLLFVVC